jgi:threonine aldolase
MEDAVLLILTGTLCARLFFLGLLGKEAGMFCASGTMSNLLGLAAHCNRGDEIILGNRNHVFQYEGGGASCLLGVAYHTVPTKEDGTNDLQDIRDGAFRAH